MFQAKEIGGGVRRPCRKKESADPKVRDNEVCPGTCKSFEGQGIGEEGEVRSVES